MRTKVVIAALLLSGCSMGYWPKVEGEAGARYQADVRECQTVSQTAIDHVTYALTFATGGFLGAATSVGAAALDNPDAHKRAAIDTCMAQRGYRVSKME